MVVAEMVNIDLYISFLFIILNHRTFIGCWYMSGTYCVRQNTRLYRSFVPATIGSRNVGFGKFWPRSFYVCGGLGARHKLYQNKREGKILLVAPCAHNTLQRALTDKLSYTQHL